MKLQKFIFQFGILSIVCFNACSQGPAKEKHISIIEKKTPENKKNSYYNNVALFLAGIKPDTVYPFNNLIKKNNWIKYSNSFDSIWNKVEETSLIKIENWGDSELTDINKDLKTLFYPFSGPDFLYATHFFPNANKYILFGLEKTGSVPDLKKLNDKSTANLFVSINKALDEILNLSFFITKQMCSELNNQDVDGALPVILLFMARTGNTIKDIKNATIENDGKLTIADTFIVYKGSNRYGKGVEITFNPPNNDTLIKKLYYFSADLTDEALAKNTGCKIYLQNLDTNVTTFLKSASYLLHNSLFTFVRNTVLNKSEEILQDDSGIAYHFFDKSNWNFQLYGSYVKPISDFSYCYQKDLNKEYEKGSKAFDFKYGYGKGLNMLLARKVKK